MSASAPGLKHVYDHFFSPNICSKTARPIKIKLYGASVGRGELFTKFTEVFLIMYVMYILIYDTFNKQITHSLTHSLTVHINSTGHMTMTTATPIAYIWLSRSRLRSVVVKLLTLWTRGRGFDPGLPPVFRIRF